MAFNLIYNIYLVIRLCRKNSYEVVENYETIEKN